MFPQTFVTLLGVVALSSTRNVTDDDYYPWFPPINLTIESRIHGGSLTGRAVPCVAALVQKVPNGIVQRCTTTYLGDVWALTAAHCVRNLPVGPGSNTFMYLGTYDARKPVFTANVLAAIPAPKWNGNPSFGEDVALIQFDKKPYSPNIKPVCLSGARKVEGVSFTAMGWGRTSCPGPSSLELKQSQGVGTEKCSGKFGDPKRKLCAKFKPNGMVDKGDSGGPLFYKSTTGKLVQVGVLSRVLDDKKGTGCPDPNDPPEYARISEFIPWIKTKYPQVCVDGRGFSLGFGGGKQIKPSSSSGKPKPSKPASGGSKCSGLFNCFSGKKQQKPSGG